jgi:hypothetical protein
MRSLSHLIVLLLGASPFTAAVAAEPSSICQELAAQVRQSAPAATESASVGFTLL